MHVDLRVGESLLIGDTRVTLAFKSGQRATLSVEAPRDVAIHRPKKINPSAQECASSADMAKEHPHG